MNSFKPLTTYKGFVVPEDYVSGTMDGFDAVNYLQTLGLSDKATDLFYTLKAIPVPPGIEVTNVESNNVYNQNKPLPIASDDIQTFEDFQGYAAQQSEWQIRDLATGEEVNMTPEEGALEFIGEVADQLQELLNNNDIDGAIDLLDKFKERIQDIDNLGNLDVYVDRLNNLGNILEAKRDQQSDALAGLDNIPLEDKQLIESLVERYGELRVVAEFWGFLDRDNLDQYGFRITSKFSQKKYGQRAFDIGLVIGVFEMSGMYDSAAKLIDFVEAGRKTQTLNARDLIGFLPYNTTPREALTFLQKLADISNDKPSSTEEAYKHREQQLLQMVELTRNFVQSKKQAQISTAEEVNEKINNYIDRLRRIQANSDSDEFSGLISSVEINAKIAAKTKVFRNGKDLFVGLSVARDLESTRQLFSKHYQLYNPSTGEVLNNFSEVTGDYFDEWVLQPSKANVTGGVDFAKDVDDFLSRTPAHNVLRKTFKGGYANQEVRLYDAYSARYKNQNQDIYDSVMYRVFNRVSGSAYKNMSKKELQPIIRDAIAEGLDDAGVEGYDMDVVNEVAGNVYTKVKQSPAWKSANFSSANITKNAKDMAVHLAFIQHQSYAVKSLDSIERHNLNDFVDLAYKVVGPNAELDMLTGLFSSADVDNPDAAVFISLTSGMRHIPYNPANNSLDYSPERRRQLLAEIGRSELPIEVFDDVVNNADVMRDVFFRLHETNYEEEFSDVIVNSIKRNASRALHVRATETKSRGSSILSSDVADQMQVSRKAVNPNDFNSHANIQAVSKSLTNNGELLGQLKSTATQESARQQILTNLRSELSGVSTDVADAFESYLDEMLVSGIERYNRNTTETYGAAFEPLSQFGELVSYAKAGQVSNVQRVTEGANGYINGLSWTSGEGDTAVEHVFGSPSIAGGGTVDFMHIKIDRANNSIEVTPSEVKQEKEYGALAHYRDPQKFLTTVLDSVQSLANQTGNPNVNLSISDLRHITMSHETNEVVVEPVRLRMPRALNPKKAGAHGASSEAVSGRR